MRAKKVYESLNFERGREIKSSLKIGKRHQIEEWFSLYAPNADYTISKNLNLTVNGNLICSNNNLTSLPDNLTVKGSLHCSNNNLTSLPDNLTVKGSLHCSNNNLTSLPDNLTVNGSLHCYNNKLPKNIKKPSGVNKMINK